MPAARQSPHPETDMRLARHRPALLWTVAMLTALAAIGAGVFLGELQQVMLNAASICLACMGIG